MEPAGGLGGQAALSGLWPASCPASLCILMTREQGSLLPLPTRAPGYNGKAEGPPPPLLAEESQSSFSLFQIQYMSGEGKVSFFPKKMFFPTNAVQASQALSHCISQRVEREGQSSQQPSPSPHPTQKEPCALAVN